MPRFATAIREALNNTVKHSQARERFNHPARFPRIVAAVRCRMMETVRRSAEAVAMQFIRPDDSTGIGISDVEERARALGGSAICGPYHEVGACSYPSPSRRWLGNDATGERSAH